MGTNSTDRLLNAPVGALASLDLHACGVLHGLGIDFRHGQQTLREASAALRIDVPALCAALAMLDLPATEIEGHRVDWCDLDIACGHLVRGHHAGLRRTLMELRYSLPHEVRAGATATAAPDPRAQVTQLAEDVLVHFAKEENILFPAFSALADARRGKAAPLALPFPSVSHPIRVMETDHARIEDRLQSLSSSIAMAMNEPDAPDAWSRLHRLSSQFTRELAAHARFESEWLFSRALEIEHALSAL